MNKIEKYANFDHQPGKLASHLKMNIMEMEKTLKSEKFMIIMACQTTFQQKLS